MSTNSRIGILHEDGTTETIYCHWDGSPEHQMPILIKHYDTAEKVKALLALGDISILGERLAPNADEPHSFKEPVDDVTVAYHRDHGERKIVAQRDRSIDDMRCIEQDIDWFYLFDAVNGKWLPPIRGLTRSALRCWLAPRSPVCGFPTMNNYFPTTESRPHGAFVGVLGRGDIYTILPEI